MRASMVISGFMLALCGLLLFLALDGAAWIALGAGGVLVMGAGFVVAEVTEKIEPPEGHIFCPFCSTPVAIGQERCAHCNGLQNDWESRGRQSL